MKNNLSLLSLLIILISCSKSDKVPNPCEGLMNEAPPTELMLKFMDKTNNATFNFTAADIKIIDSKTGNEFKNWRLLNRTGIASLDGSLSMAVFPGPEGEYSYDIQLLNKGTVTFSYQVTKQQTNDICKPHVYPIGNLKTTNQAYSIFQHEGKSYPKILIVTL